MPPTLEPCFEGETACLSKFCMLSISMVRIVPLFLLKDFSIFSEKTTLWCPTGMFPLSFFHQPLPCPAVSEMRTREWEPQHTYMYNLKLREVIAWNLVQLLPREFNPFNQLSPHVRVISKLLRYSNQSQCVFVVRHKTDFGIQLGNNTGTDFLDPTFETGYKNIVLVLNLDDFL